jgi:hypothetical protein
MSTPFGKDMMLLLPVSEKLEFAGEECRRLAQDDLYNYVKLRKAECYQPHEEFGWNVEYMGDLAYMSVNAPEHYRERWAAALDRFVEICKIFRLQNPDVE